MLAKGFCARPYHDAYDEAANNARRATRSVLSSFGCRVSSSVGVGAQSIARYSRSRYSKSSTVRCNSESGWLMFAGIETRDRSLPMFLRSRSQIENDWFSGCGAGKRSRGKRPYAASSSSSDSELDASAAPEETEVASSSSSSSSSSSRSVRSAPFAARLREMTKSCLFTTSAATSRSRSSTSS